MRAGGRTREGVEVSAMPPKHSEKQIRDTLNVWRYLHKPQLFLHRNEQAASVTVD